MNEFHRLVHAARHSKVEVRKSNRTTEPTVPQTHRGGHRGESRKASPCDVLVKPAQGTDQNTPAANMALQARRKTLPFPASDLPL
jgi:hypothetical protein